MCPPPSGPALCPAPAPAWPPRGQGLPARAILAGPQGERVPEPYLLEHSVQLGLTVVRLCPVPQDLITGVSVSVPKPQASQSWCLDPVLLLQPESQLR